MNKPRLVIETLSEILLAGVLVTIFGFSFWGLLNLNPNTKSVSPVLGIAVSKNPWTFNVVKDTVQHNLVASDQTFTTGYDLILNDSKPKSFNLFSINNNDKASQRYSINVQIADELKQFLKLTLQSDEKEFVILNGPVDTKYSEVNLTLAGKTSINPSIRLTPYSEGLDKVSVKITVTKISD